MIDCWCFQPDRKRGECHIRPDPSGVRVLRYLLGLILLVFLGAVGLFAIQNTQPVTVKFWKSSITAPFAFLAVGAYFFGMISGWNVIAFVRSSINRVRSRPVEDQ
jgi:lipopolysaccharide assembly protein A